MLKPEICLIDILLPGMDGIELIRRIKPKYKGRCILVVTGHDIDVYRKTALEAGAHDIVSKSDVQKLLLSIKDLVKKYRIDGCK